MSKIALITGATSGIGKQLSIIHAERGNDLVVVSRSEKHLNGLKAQLESQYDISVHVIAKDLTQPNAVKEIYDILKEQNVVIDYLINNAGFGGSGNFHERDWNVDQSMIQLNIIALTELCHRFLPDMVARNSGKILNVSSTASLMPGPLQAVYFASKAYVTSLSNALSEELSDTAITVTNLMPGATETNFAKTAGLENSPLFANTASAHSVALAGYEGMLKGKMDVKAGLSLGQSILLKTLPFTPKKIVMSQIKKMQE
jgi:short-subunit dehydrogenase